MQELTNELFQEAGLTWISGYFLPSKLVVDPTKVVYVAQLGLATEQKHEHAVITCSNLHAWLQNYPAGQKTQQLAQEKGFELTFQMVPNHPGWVYLNCFMPMDKTIFE